MPDDARPPSIADMPAQVAATPATPAEARGRFFNTGNAFNVQLPPVPDHSFTAEPRRALDPATPTGLNRVRSFIRTGLPVSGHFAVGAGPLRENPCR
jgi:hypothetical protein